VGGAGMNRAAQASAGFAMFCRFERLCRSTSPPTPTPMRAGSGPRSGTSTRKRAPLHCVKAGFAFISLASRLLCSALSGGLLQASGLTLVGDQSSPASGPHSGKPLR